MTKQEIRHIATQIVDEFLLNPKINLDEVIAEKILELGIDEKFIRMIVSAVNTEIYLRYMQMGRAKEFPAAASDRVEKIIQGLIAEVVPKEAEADQDAPVPRSLLLKTMESKESKTADYKESAIRAKIADLEYDFDIKGYKRLPTIISAFRFDMGSKYGEQGLARLKGWLVENGYQKEAEEIFPGIGISTVSMFIDNSHLEEAIEIAKAVKDAEEITDKINTLKRLVNNE